MKKMNEKMNEKLNESFWEKPQLIVLGLETTAAGTTLSNNDAYECAIS